MQHRMSRRHTQRCRQEPDCVAHEVVMLHRRTLVRLALVRLFVQDVPLILLDNL